MKRMIREVADGLWLDVGRISEVIDPQKAQGSWANDDSALIIVMENGNVYSIPPREGVGSETMIRNLFTGGHE